MLCVSRKIDLSSFMSVSSFLGNPPRKQEILGVTGQLGPPWSPLEMSSDDVVSANLWSAEPQTFCLLLPLNNLFGA